MQYLKIPYVKWFHRDNQDIIPRRFVIGKNHSKVADLITRSVFDLLQEGEPLCSPDIEDILAEDGYKLYLLEDKGLLHISARNGIDVIDREPPKFGYSQYTWGTSPNWNTDQDFVNSVFDIVDYNVKLLGFWDKLVQQESSPCTMLQKRLLARVENEYIFYRKKHLAALMNKVKFTFD